MELREMLKNQIAARAQAWEKAKDHLDTVEGEGRAMTGEHDETWKRFMGELDELDARIADTRTLIESDAAAEETRALSERLGQDHDGDRRDDTNTEAARLRALVAGEQRSVEFRFADGDDWSFATGERRDLVEGTNSAGVYTVPTSFVNRLYEHLIVNSAIRQTRATVINTDWGEALQVPKTTAYGSGALVSEGSAISEGDPTFGQVTLNAYKYGVLAL